MFKESGLPSAIVSPLEHFGKAAACLTLASQGLLGQGCAKIDVEFRDVDGDGIPDFVICTTTVELTNTS